MSKIKRPMTVKQLKAALAKAPDEAPVFADIETDDGDVVLSVPVFSVIVDTDVPDGHVPDVLLFTYPNE